LVRGKIAKGNFVQGMQHPRIFDRGNIGRGRANIAPTKLYLVHIIKKIFTFLMNETERGSHLPATSPKREYLAVKEI
jgi:hypothetical protein